MQRTARGNRYYKNRSRRKTSNNTRTILSVGLIKQSIACILIVFAITYMQKTPNRYTDRFLAEIKKQLIETNIQVSEIYASFKNLYSQYSKYIRSVLE